MAGEGLTVAEEHEVRIVAWPEDAARVEHAIGGDGPLPVRVAFDPETPATVIVGTDERPLDVDMRMRVSAKEPVPLSITVREPICATSDYTVGISIFDNPFGSIRVRGETKFALCSERPEPVESCTDFRNLVADGEFPTPVTHGKVRLAPLGEPLRSVAFGEPAGQTKLAFPPTGVRVEFPQTVRGVRLVVGGHADPHFRFSVYGPGGRIGDFSEQISNETRSVEVPHSGVSAVEIRGGGGEAFLVEVCATPQQL